MSVATYAAAQILRILPRVRITRAVGRLADARMSRPVASTVVGLFAKAYDVDLGEAIRPEGGYDSFDAFFTRRLREGARPTCADPKAIVSPSDGRVEAIGPVERGGRFLIKGREYRADELLGDLDEAKRFEGGHFAVVYLSPRDYHRVHAPVAGDVVEVRSMPGDLFPVNAIGERHVDSLFSINRRVAIAIDTPASDHAPNGGRVTVVMVGAMIVGRITVTAIDARDVPLGTHRVSPAFHVERGDEIGIFHLGSTAVVFVEPGAPALVRHTGPIRLGEPLSHAASGNGSSTR
jgi:phosphatidylserine decarboxylase